LNDGRGGFWGFWTTRPGILSGVAAVVTAFVALAGVFIARDDGNGGDTPSAVTGTSLADWRREANSLCADSNRALRETFGRPPRGPDELVAYYDGAILVVTRTLIDLRELDMPANRAHDITKFLDSLEARNANIEEAFAAWQGGNLPAFQRAAREVDRANNKAFELASNLRAHKCARGPFS
jgi:hypothetical protein